MRIPDPASNHRILIVDDNAAIHDDFRKVLKGRSQSPDVSVAEFRLFGTRTGTVVPEFELDSAYQGCEAIEMIKQARAAGRPYAMAFVDVRMPPGLDGIETAEGIWKTDSDVQVVLCTAFSDYSWTDVRNRLGRSERLLILKKPFDNMEVLQLAAALTEKWRLIQQVTHQVEQLEETVRERTSELQRREEHYRLITENAGDLIGLIDAGGKVAYRSPSYERLLGYNALELADLDTFGWADPADREAAIAAARECLEGGIQRILEFRARRKDGTLLAVESTCAPFRDGSGRITGALLVTRDVTQRRMLELQLQHAQKMESIGRLAAGIAHEINTPMQFIADNAHFLLEAFGKFDAVLDAYRALAAVAAIHPDCAEAVRAATEADSTAELWYMQAEIPRCIQQSLEGLTRVSRIVCSLKEFAHPSSPELAPANLNEMVERSLIVSRHEWKYLAETVTVLDPALPEVPCVLDELNQVMLNLIINAAHAIADALKARGEEQGTITVRTRREDSWAVIEVEDTGTGIAPEIRDRIFEPFFTTKPVGKGTGQGLAMVHAAIVKHHRGLIEVKSEPGRGSVFVLKLPLSAAPKPVG